MRLIYRAGFQLIKVQAITVLSLVCAAGAIWWGWDLFSAYGLRPADGGVLAPFGTRLALGLAVAALGIAFAGGMALYGRVYATHIRHDPATGRFRVTLATWLPGERSFAFSGDDIERASWHRPRVRAEDAPWISLGVRGRRLSILIDGRGIFLPDRAAAAALLRLPAGDAREFVDWRPYA